MDGAISQRLRSLIVAYETRKEKTPPFERTAGVSKLEKAFENYKVNYRRYKTLKRKGILP